jgi:hypothetical protein
VKRSIADGSVGFPHVRVGHRQPLILKPLISNGQGFFYALMLRYEIRVEQLINDGYCEGRVKASPSISAFLAFTRSIIKWINAFIFALSLMSG